MKQLKLGDFSSKAVLVLCGLLNLLITVRDKLIQDYRHVGVALSMLYNGIFPLIITVFYQSYFA